MQLGYHKWRTNYLRLGIDNHAMLNQKWDELLVLHHLRASYTWMQGCKAILQKSFGEAFDQTPTHVYVRNANFVCWYDGTALLEEARCHGEVALLASHVQRGLPALPEKRISCTNPQSHATELWIQTHFMFICAVSNPVHEYILDSVIESVQKGKYKVQLWCVLILVLYWGVELNGCYSSSIIDFLPNQFYLLGEKNGAKQSKWLSN